MGKRRTIITTIRDRLNEGKLSAGGYTASFTAQLFAVTQKKISLPLFSIVTEPENISVNLSGTTGDRSLRLIIQGFLLSRKSTVSIAQSESLLVGEDFVDLIVDKFLEGESQEKFAMAFPNEPGCGFSVTAIGPIIVEEYALAADYVYMSIPLVTEFLQGRG